MKILAVHIVEGRIIPWYLGIAYWRWDSAIAVCYPVPLNLVVRAMRNMYFWLKATHRPDWAHRLWDDAYQAGYIEGCRQVLKSLNKPTGELHGD